jgi:hypothetical protein
MPSLKTIPDDVRTWNDAITRDAIQQGLDAAVGVGGYQVNAAYLEGNHGQDGTTWRGPGYEDGKLAKATWEGIKATTYVSVPEIESCVGRRADAACAGEADFSLSPKEPAGAKNDAGEPQPSDDQLAYAAEWAGDVGAWWKRARPVSAWEAHKASVRHASASKVACIRLFWNQRHTQQDATGRRFIMRPDRRSAMETVEIMAPPPSACYVYHHPDTLAPVGIYRYKTADDKDAVELWFLEGEKTVCRQVEGEAEVREIAYDWGGVLPIVPLTIPAILTQPVRDLQAAADTTATLAMRNLVTHGYPQRDEINVRPAGEFKDEPNPADPTPYREKIDGKIKYLWRGFRELGASVTNNLFGIESTKRVKDDGGEIVEEVEYQTPSVVYHEPSDPENILKGLDKWTSKIREACHQGHIVDSGSTAEASGDAYEQKRAEFATDVEAVAEAVARLNEGVLIALTVMAEEVTQGGDPWAFVEDWSVLSQVRADPGPVSSEKQRTTMEQVNAGLLSQRTGQAAIGINDTDAEAERLAAERHPKIVAERAAAAAALIAAGVRKVEAWKEVGYDEQRAKELAEREQNDFVETEEDE